MEFSFCCGSPVTCNSEDRTLHANKCFNWTI